VQWFVGAAKKIGSAVSLSDYCLAPPSKGFWNDEIIQENPSLRGSGLRLTTRDIRGPSDVAWDLWDLPGSPVSVVALAVDNGAIQPGTAVDLRPHVAKKTLRWQAPVGTWKLVVIYPETIYWSLDPMNPLAGKKVVEKLFRRFEEHCPGESGKGLNFFFSDELDLGINGEWMGGTLWSAGVAEEFRKRKRYDLSPELAALFMDIGPRTPKVRLDYRDVMVALSEENYFRPLFQWNFDHGMLYGCDHGYRGNNVVEFGDYYRTQRGCSARATTRRG